MDQEQNNTLFISNYLYVVISPGAHPNRFTHPTATENIKFRKTQTHKQTAKNNFCVCIFGAENNKFYAMGQPEYWCTL
jgi:hypothetical protein